ncbi:N-acetylneuraminate epimerase [Escherichia coli]
MPLLLMEISFWLGGAYFPGAAEKYSNGEYWSHKGLDKAYSKEIYQLIKNDWKKVGSLPEGLAYGVSLPWQGGCSFWVGRKKMVKLFQMLFI